MLINNINYFNIKYNILKEVFFDYFKKNYNNSLRKDDGASILFCVFMNEK